jgi:hypothetical protein
MQDVRDGSSNTLALSERRIGNRAVRTDIANVALNFNPPDVNSSDPTAWYDACRMSASNSNGREYNESTTILDSARPGERWQDGRPYYAGFNTIMPPNGPSCITDNGDWYKGNFAASSRHPSIVTVCMADGSVRTIDENIDLNIWMALGTRKGGEPIGEF